MTEIFESRGSSVRPTKLREIKVYGKKHLLILFGFPCRGHLLPPVESSRRRYSQETTASAVAIVKATTQPLRIPRCTDYLPSQEERCRDKDPPHEAVEKYFYIDNGRSVDRYLSRLKISRGIRSNSLVALHYS